MIGAPVPLRSPARLPSRNIRTPEMPTRKIIQMSVNKTAQKAAMTSSRVNACLIGIAAAASESRRTFRPNRKNTIAATWRQYHKRPRPRWYFSKRSPISDSSSAPEQKSFRNHVATAGAGWILMPLLLSAVEGCHLFKSLEQINGAVKYARELHDMHATLSELYGI